MVSSDVMANFTEQAPGNAKRRERRMAEGARWKRGVIRNLEVGLDFEAFHVSSPALLSPILFVYSYYFF
jgi:hypothetical protein